jgi:dTDP-4-dehydrorhamnose reductase
MKKILVTGSNGQVGQELNYWAAQFPQFEFLFTDRKTLDITNIEAIEDFLHSNHVHYALNCAAYTAVDKAESERELALEINAQGAFYLAQNCALQGIPMMHLSTDYVYHGSKRSPMIETDLVNPMGVYAETKLMGENAILQAHPCSMIIRTSWVYSTYGANFVKTMLRLGAERSELRVVADQIGTPTYARDLAKTMLDIVQKIDTHQIDLNYWQGIYHYSNEGVTNWADFATAIFKQKNIPCHVIPIATKDYPTAAQRPPYSVLDKTKIKTTFGVEIEDWEGALERMLSSSNGE